jgi:5-methylcytosine-specific restriction endonuclease McrA
MSLRYAHAADGTEMYPQFVCDVCDEAITDLHTGNVEWINGTADESSDVVYFTHKRCSHILRNILSHQQGTRVTTSWDELHLFPIQVMSNAGMLRAARAAYDQRRAPADEEPIQDSTGLTLRFRVFKRDGYRCQICGRSAPDGARLEADHKVPRSKGGPDTLANLWTLCFECNRGKRDSYL